MHDKQIARLTFKPASVFNIFELPLLNEFQSERVGISALPPAAVDVLVHSGKPDLQSPFIRWMTENRIIEVMARIIIHILPEQREPFRKGDRDITNFPANLRHCQDSLYVCQDV